MCGHYKKERFFNKSNLSRIYGEYSDMQDSLKAQAFYSQVQNKLKLSLRRLRTHPRLENTVSTSMELLIRVLELIRTLFMLRR